MARAIFEFRKNRCAGCWRLLVSETTLAALDSGYGSWLLFCDGSCRRQRHAAKAGPQADVSTAMPPDAVSV